MNLLLLQSVLHQVAHRLREGMRKTKSIVLGGGGDSQGVNLLVLESVLHKVAHGLRGAGTPNTNCVGGRGREITKVAWVEGGETREESACFRKALAARVRKLLYYE